MYVAHVAASLVFYVLRACLWGVLCTCMHALSVFVGLGQSIYRLGVCLCSLVLLLFVFLVFGGLMFLLL